MEKIPIHSISGEAYCHESEDLEKVKKAFYLFFPKKSVKEERVDAGFGTEVTILRAKLDKKAAREVAGKLIKEIVPLEKRRLLSETELRLSEEGSFCIMLDKQLAFEEEKIALTDSEDCIKVTLSIEAFPTSHANFIRSVQELLKH